jgi:hypothetical protein
VDAAVDEVVFVEAYGYDVINIDIGSALWLCWWK